MGRRERRKELTRKALLEAAMSLFSERGVHATRLADITERADLGKGAFYNYFDSKDALVAALVGEGTDLLGSRYLTDLPAAGPERVGAVVRAHYAFFRDHPEYVMLFHQARGLLKVRTEGATNLRAVFRRYLALIGQALLPGAETAAVARENLAALVVGTISGYLSFRLATGAEAEPELVQRVLVAGVPAALGPT